MRKLYIAEMARADMEKPADEKIVNRILIDILKDIKETCHVGNGLVKFKFVETNMFSYHARVRIGGMVWCHTTMYARLCEIDLVKTKLKELGYKLLDLHVDHYSDAPLRFRIRWDGKPYEKV